MKKAFLAIALLFAFGMSANAQLSHIGVRFGGGQGYGAELSTIWNNNIEADLGLNSGDGYTNFALTGIYQWRGDLGSNFGWFAGVGAKLAYWNWEYNYDGDGRIGIALAGQAGVEYNFQAVPIQLSLDIRPAFWILPSTDFHWGDIAFGIRYRF